jgi:hypothetical protein
LITRIIFGDEYRSLSSLFCSLLHSPVASSLLGPNIALYPCCISLHNKIFLFAFRLYNTSLVFSLAAFQLRVISPFLYPTALPNFIYIYIKSVFSSSFLKLHRW